MKIFRSCVMAGFAVAAVAVVAACGSSGSSSSSAQSASTSSAANEPDHDRGVALALGRLRRRRPGLPARLPALGGDQNAKGGLLGRKVKLDIISDASSPAQVVSNYQKLIGSNKDRARVRTVLDAADGPVRARGGAVWLRVRRGCRRRPGGVRLRAEQRLRRLDPGQEQPRHVRTVDRLAAGGAATEDGGLRDGQRPVHPAADPGRAEHPRSRRSQDRLLEGLPGRGDGLHADRRPGGLGQADVVVLGSVDVPTVSAFVHAFIQQHYNPKVFIATSGPDQGAAFVKAVGPGNENGIMVPNGWYRRASRRPTASRWSRSTSPSTAERPRTSTPTWPRRTPSAR